MVNLSLICDDFIIAFYVTQKITAFIFGFHYSSESRLRCIFAESLGGIVPSGLDKHLEESAIGMNKS